MNGGDWAGNPAGLGQQVQEKRRQLQRLRVLRGQHFGQPAVLQPRRKTGDSRLHGMLAAGSLLIGYLGGLAALLIATGLAGGLLLVRQWARAPQGAATVTETSEQRIRQLERELRDLEQQLQREADLG